MCCGFIYYFHLYISGVYLDIMGTINRNEINCNDNNNDNDEDGRNPNPNRNVKNYENGNAIDNCSKL